MPELFLPKGYRENPAPQPWVRKHGVAEPQHHVYLAARALADDCGLSRVLDFGCGDGLMMRKHFAGLTVLGVDTPKNADRSSDVVADDLNFCRHANVYFDSGADLVVCADVIEHLVNPLPLLDCIAALMETGARVIISTPERSLKRGWGNFDAPGNPQHVREWAVDEFQQLIWHYLKRHPKIFLVPSSEFSKSVATMMVIL